MVYVDPTKANGAYAVPERKQVLEFLGNTLFIPVFFVSVGYLINPRVFLSTTASNFGLVSCIVLGLIGSKLLAAFVAKGLYRYSRDEALVMWSLSLPQVAATLAAALVAYKARNAAGQRLIDEAVLNSVIVLMVVTSALGPILTEVFGRRIAAQAPAAPPAGPMVNSEPPGASVTQSSVEQAS